MNKEELLLKEYESEDRKRLMRSGKYPSPLTGRQDEISKELESLGYSIVADRSNPVRPLFRLISNRS